MKSFEITLVDEQRNYEVIRFLHVIIKGLNLSNSPCEADDEQENGMYKFRVKNMTSKQVRAMADVLDSVYKRTDLANFILR